MDIILFTVCIASLLIIAYIFGTSRKSKLEPPGPYPLPLIGNLIYIARQDPINYKAMHKVSQIYGDLVTLMLGPNKTLLASSYEVAKDLYSSPNCLNRPISGSIWDRTLQQNIGMAFSNHEGWSSIRKFSSKGLREYGFGNKSEMERLIHDELKHVLARLENHVKESKNGVICFHNYFQPSFLNLMTSLIINERLSYDDKNLKKLIKASSDWFDVPLIGIFIVMAFPWTRYICPGLLGYTKQINALRDMYSFCLTILNGRWEKNVFLKEPECFADLYLKAAHENIDNPSSIFTDDQFQVLCTDLLQGGTDTTSNWLSWAILLLMVNPDAQEKIFQEIVTTIGLERRPTGSDKKQMVYTEAVICEVHRLASLTVILPPRETTQDFMYKNFLLKKGSTILVNLHSCFMDPRVWKDPKEFRPERFINSKGELVDTEIISIAFGAGRRMCFGEPMAKEGSFLYLTTLLQKFKFSLPPNFEMPDMEPLTAIILSPKPFHALVEKRT